MIFQTCNGIDPCCKDKMVNFDGERKDKKTTVGRRVLN